MLSLSDRLGRKARLIAAAASCLLLAACGFAPLYGAHEGKEGAGEALSRVEIAPLPNQDGQELRNLLIDAFYPHGRPTHTDYLLTVALTSSENQLGIQSDATATRAIMTVRAVYSLKDKASGKALFSTQDQATVSYAIEQAQFGIVQARQNALDRGITQLSTLITTHTAAALQK